jgi:hypothetical protein
MDERPTCGKGLAEHSVIPGKLGDLIAALAENLEVHMEALPLDDANARAEYEAYARLSAAHRDIAKRLRAVAAQMADYRDLPMGAHDEKALADPKGLRAFAKFVNVEQALLALLKESAERDARMLAELGGG